MGIVSRIRLVSTGRVGGCNKVFAGHFLLRPLAIEASREVVPGVSSGSIAEWMYLTTVFYATTGGLTQTPMH